MLDCLWRAELAALRAKSAPRYCGRLVHHPWRPVGKHAASRLAVVGAFAGLVVGSFVRRPRGRDMRRLAKGHSKQSLGARQQSMLDRLQQRAAALGGKCLAIGYKNSTTKVPWQCQHGHTWDAMPLNVLNNKTWCPECARNRRQIPLQRLQDQARARGGRCLSTSKYNSTRTKVLWQCKLGHI